MRVFNIAVWAALAIVATVPSFAGAQEEILEPVAAEAIVPDILRSGKVDGVRLSEKDDVLKFYQEHNGDFLWVKEGRYNRAAEQVLDLMRDAGSHGLNPARYHIDTLGARMERQWTAPQDKAQAELLMTDAVVLYARDLTGMRLSPKEADADSSSWSRGVSAHSLLNVLSSSGDLARTLTLLAPQDDLYRDLRKELKKAMDQYEADVKAGVVRISFSALLRHGQSHPVVPAIRKALGGEESTSQIYDSDLENEVAKFQRAHGLKPDGIIGPRTVAALNEGPREKIVKILANLERLRWVRRPLPARYVEVNIPAMWLKAVEGNRTVFEMPVIVGKKKRPTMSFVDEIVGIRFNPSWYVPDTIKRQDYLPELKKNPRALAEKGIAFRVRDAEEGRMVNVSPEDINWENMSLGELKSIQMVQGPGAANALGVIRVLMPNRYDIYLHDTNAPSLFKKDDRSLSSGCVRLSEPRRIVGFILGHNPSWSDDRMEAYLKQGKTREVSAVEPVPVYLFYFSIWKDKGGELVYGQDLYGQDEALVKALKNKGQINLPMI